MSTTTYVRNKKNIITFLLKKAPYLELCLGICTDDLFAR